MSWSGVGTCARACGGAVVGADASQGARGKWRRPRKAEAAPGGRRKRYRGAADERARGVSDTRQRVRGSGGLAWAELGRASACGSGRAGRRERERWLGRRFSRPRQLCGLGQAGVG